MTATPRQLSDAIQADYDEIIEGRTEETRTLNRWRTIRSVSGWTAFGVAAALVAILVLTIGTGSLVGFILAVLLSFAAPLLFIPALVVWIVASVAAARIEAGRRTDMFTLYGITIDHTINPPVYSVAGMSPSLMNPRLHRSWKLLTGADVTADSADEQ